MIELNINDLTKDQNDAINRLHDFNDTLLVADMGAGKTVCALTAISELLEDNVFGRVLIIAPLKVCNKVWQHEHKKWEHLTHLSVAIATGEPAERRAAVESKSDILVINFENVQWLFKQYKKNHRCDGLVVDELSKLKKAGGAIFKSLRPQIKRFSWRVGMTGTPVSEDWLGLYSMMLVVDNGEALGTRGDEYRYKYFRPLDYNEYSWILRDGMAEKIAHRIRNTMYVMPDYRHELPPINYVTAYVEMPKSVRELYDLLCKDYVLNVKGREVEATSEAVLSGKLQQIASGFLYSDDKLQAIPLHNKKYDALNGWIGKRPIVIVYWFKHELTELKKRYPDAGVIGEDDSAVDEWNAGRLNTLLLHPRSAGHGLNLAAGGALLVWLSPVWSRDLWTQTNARLWRRGQTEAVTVVSILSTGTVDDVIVRRVESKAGHHTLLMEHIKKASD